MLPPGIVQLVLEFPQPVLIVSITGEILASNPKAIRIFGASAVPCTMLSDLIASPPQKLLKYLHLCAGSNEAVPGAFAPLANPALHCRFDGSGMALAADDSRCVWLFIRTHDQAVSPFIALNEHVEYLHGALHARTRTEAALRAHSAQFETLLNRSPLGIYLVDSHLRILQMNPLAERSLGAIGAVGEGLEQIFRRTFSPDLAADTLGHFRHTLETGEPFIVPETTDQRIGPAELQKYYAWQIHRIPLSDGTQGLVCYFQDISARKQAEDALRKTEKLAAVGRLAASIAHEINNPLEAVTNLLFLARADSSLSEQARQYLSAADSELERITHLTRQTLGFYRDSTAPTFFEPSAIVKSILELYEHRFEARKVRLVAQLEKTPPVFGFAGEFRQVLSNLITNALDAMDKLNIVNSPGGVLTARTRRAHSWRTSADGVRLTISDTGSGIEPNSIDRIFDAFFTTKKDTGTGLGLWLSQEIVQKHEGYIHVRSRVCPGRKGTIFTVFWPFRPAAFSPPEIEEQPIAMAS